MDCGVFSETVTNMDVGVEPPGMGSRRVSEKTPESMQRGAQQIANPKHWPQTAMQADRRYYTDLHPPGYLPMHNEPI
jgi:hypothetical protein